MDEFKRIKMSLFLILLLQSTAVTGQENSLTVRVGDEVTLPCDIEGDNQDNCDWSFGEAENLVVTRQIDGEAESDRLNVTHNCALVIKKVTEEDAGFYTCTQIRSGESSNLLLFVATVTQHQENDEVTLSCSVVNPEYCSHQVTWLNQGWDVDTDLNTSGHTCSASFTFQPADVSPSSRLSYTCDITNVYTGEQLQLPFSPQPSGKDTKPATTEPATTEPATTEPATTEPATTEPATTENPKSGFILFPRLLRVILMSVGLAALIMIVVVVNIWTRIKEKKTQMEEITVRYDVDDGTVN
ncbi:uncharacterized protein LOC117477200 isoform X2 [Trematomus bernacchii]|uniref:uncharacterized protein LOC117477200 isoform X2 n=1 Tax=Trematomus bernacchii TaxID=40690 RepID=UPI00146BE3FD|nr:uncharacterized protein LOC117477200 isoform X2 [Trematomus bernacchii]